MATSTYTALLTQTLSTAAASVTFSSIPQGYTDLVLAINANAASNSTFTMRFNGDTATNYSFTSLGGDGTTASSGRNANMTWFYLGDIAGAQIGNTNIQIQNYANATTYKTCLIRNNVAAYSTNATVGLWRKTPEAINSITLLTYTGANLVIGSTFTIYGIQSASVGAKATGGIISSDANYFYHTFAASGTFTPTQSLTADCLVVAGGGGGGFDTGGGGGAGGLLAYTAQSLTATNYTCTVGAGGASSTATTLAGSNGTNSSFAGLTASVGGGGGGSWQKVPVAGGSGGGTSGQFKTLATGTSGQGNNGGVNGASVTDGGSGGGGAGAVGVNKIATAGIGGNGGIGTTSSLINSIAAATGIGELFDANYYFAGGGGGSSRNNTYSPGLGGIGGGGRGGNLRVANIPAVNGMANTGGGGGGTDLDYTGLGSGGSGIVIIRYPK